MSDLVFDVGMHNGDDTAYYLARGYRVVAVDANPIMCARARERFAREIKAGQLSVRNIGIAETQGEMDFWVSSVTEWSSFDFEWATTGAATATSVRVETLPFRQLIEEEGIPFFAKIDIEGNDSLCLKDLAGTESRPAYLSFESPIHFDADIELLKSLHYRSFKCVRQNDLREITPRNVVYQEEFWRVLKALQRLPRPGRLRKYSFGPGGRLQRLHYRRRPINGWQFNLGSSGPLGVELPGRWLTPDEMLSVWHQLIAYNLRLSDRGGLGNEWFDIHAALSTEQGS